MTTIPDSEITWKFVRSGGPGGQNVNKVASKAVLIWDIAATVTIPDEVKIRLALHHKRFFTKDGFLMLSSQKYRDQDRNRQDCLERLAALIEEARHVPKPRRPTKPTRGSHRRRREDKERRAQVKQARKKPVQD